jgi:hypothetical protein
MNEFTRCPEGRVYVFQYYGWGIVLGFEKNIYPCQNWKWMWEGVSGPTAKVRGEVGQIYKCL